MFLFKFEEFRHTMTTRSYQEYRALMKQGRFDEAATHAERHYLDNNPNNPFWLTRKAAALTRAGRFPEALAASEEAYALAPRNPYGILAVAEALEGSNRLEDAVRYFEEIANDPNLSLYAKKGALRCLSGMRRHDRILEYLGAWDLPESVRLEWKTKTFESAGRFEDALDACERWLKLEPDSRQALWTMTELEIRRDGLDSVLAKMERLAKIPSLPPIYKEIHASLCRRAGKTETAIKQYERLTRTASDPRILSKQAFALANSGRESEAIPLLEELLKLDPDNFYLHSSYSAACARTAKLERALAFYQNLSEQNPNVGKLYGRIKKIRKMMGQE